MTKYTPIESSTRNPMRTHPFGGFLNISDVQQAIAQRINAAQINGKPEVRDALKELLDEVNAEKASR